MKKNEMPKEHQYQLDAGKFMDANPKSYLALDMGMGKTLITIRWIQRILPEVKAVLVLAPLRTIYSSWPEELQKWAPELSYTILHGSEKNTELNKKVDVYLMNYEGITWLFNKLKEQFKKTKTVPFRGLVLDEGSKCKSSTTKRFKYLKKMCDIFPKYRTILSGTPAPNSLLDLWAQYFLLDKGDRLEPFVTAFKRLYFYQVDRMGFVWSINKGSADIIYKKIEDITYRLDASDYIDLPGRIDNIIKIDLPKKVQKQYEVLEKDFFMSLEKCDIEVFNSASLSMKLRQFVQGAVYTDTHLQGNEYIKQDGTITTGPRDYEIVHNEKLSILIDLMDEACGQGILCAIQFKFELDLILMKYPDARVIAGGTNHFEAIEIIRDWNLGKVPLLICHPASLSHGVNLQTGSHIILWFGLPWSLEQYLQLNARLFRQGQKEVVRIHHLVCKDTVDESIMKALKNKFRGQKDLLDYLKGVR